MRPRVEHLMNQPAVVCHVMDSAMNAAQLMREHQYGAIPIVDDDECLIGIVTDRDICMAACETALSLNEISVCDIMTTTVHCCGPQDTIRRVEHIMENAQVRRVPVVDKEQHIIGILSSSDLLRESAQRPASRNALSHKDVVRILAAVSKPRRQTAIVEQRPS